MIDVTDQVLESWPVGREVNVFEEMRRITLQVVVRTLLGQDLGATQSDLRAWFTTAGEYLDLSPPMNAMRLNIPGTRWAKYAKSSAPIVAGSRSTGMPAAERTYAANASASRASLTTGGYP